MQEIAMDRELDSKLDREFGVSIMVALVLAIAIEAVMPSTTVAVNELSAQPDLSWLVSP
jgi:hypothetical protein